MLAIPLADDLERPTVLLLHSDTPRTFSFDEIELAKSFASIAGAAIRDAQLFSRTDADLRRQTSRLDAIVDQGILVEASDGRCCSRTPGCASWPVRVRWKPVSARPM